MSENVSCKKKEKSHRAEDAGGAELVAVVVHDREGAGAHDRWRNWIHAGGSTRQRRQGVAEPAVRRHRRVHK